MEQPDEDPEHTGTFTKDEIEKMKAEYTKKKGKSLFD